MESIGILVIEKLEWKSQGTWKKAGFSKNKNI
jgi:hypothetical protein